MLTCIIFILSGKNEETVVWKRLLWKTEFVLASTPFINRPIPSDISTPKHRGMFIEGFTCIYIYFPQLKK